MVVGSGSIEGGEQRDVRHAFLLTGGSDKKLRYWDLTRIENSTVFSGLQVDEGKPTYSASHPTTAMTLNTERLPRGQGPSSASANNAEDRRGRRAHGADRGGGRPTRSTVISVQQQQLLKAHLDSILDLALLESPYTMTVSVDRSGVVYVFQ